MTSRSFAYKDTDSHLVDSPCKCVAFLPQSALQSLCVDSRGFQSPSAVCWRHYDVSKGASGGSMRPLKMGVLLRMRVT